MSIERPRRYPAGRKTENHLALVDIYLKRLMSDIFYEQRHHNFLVRLTPLITEYLIWLSEKGNSNLKRTGFYASWDRKSCIR
jgi:hypothetical protein